jgi:Fe-S-cluster-containing hydrogenase component 2
VICALTHFGVNNPKKARIRVINRIPLKERIEIHVCPQCSKPKCKDVCERSAIQIKDGVVKILREKCNLCGACIKICKSKAIFTHKDIPTAFKCELCFNCVSYCPTKALTKVV